MRRGENIYKRRDGRWEGRYIASRDESGKACYHSVYAPSYAEVRDKLRKFSQEFKGDRALFENVAEKWLSGVKLSCKLSTYNKYESTYRNHLLPEFRGKRISGISPQQIENLIAEKEELSDKTKAEILGNLKQILKSAERCGLYEDHAVFDLNIRRSRKEIRVLSAQEQKRLESFLLSCNTPLSTSIYLVLYTGLRIGELCALKRENIDLKTGIIHVSGTMQRLRKDDGLSRTQVIITEPKSKCSVRDIPLPKNVLNICRRFYNDLSGNSFLLTGDESYMEPRLMSYHFKKFAATCGLDDVHFHTLRHTFATRCIERGVDAKSLSEILGHYDVNVTLNRYVHPSIELKRINIEKLCR